MTSQSGLIPCKPSTSALTRRLSSLMRDKQRVPLTLTLVDLAQEPKGPPVKIFWGSQTGTAESFATKLAKVTTSHFAWCNLTTSHFAWCNFSSSEGLLWSCSN